MARTSATRAHGGLTAQQELFCREYVIRCVGKDAAIAAGYAAPNAVSTATKLLQVPRISKRIDELMQQRNARLELSADNVLRELSRLAFSDPAHAFGENGVVLSVPQMPEDTRRAIKGIDVREEYETIDGVRRFVGYVKKVTYHDKVAAIDKAMKHLGLLVDRVSVDGKLTLEELVLAARKKDAQ